MLGQSREFYHGIARKYTAIFGALFNDVWIYRTNGTSVTQDSKVPLGFGPREKYLGMNDDDPSLKRDRAMQLPRMSYQFVDIKYAADRARNPIGVLRQKTDQGVVTVANPVPFDLRYTLSIMTKTIEDGLHIVEQIVPHFKPELTVSAHLLDEMPDLRTDVAIVLDSVTHDDSYEGPYTDRRTVVWTLDFTVKAWFYGETTKPKVIKFAKVDLFPNMEKTQVYSEVKTWPGVTANGQPTTDPAQAIPYQQVEETDDWDYVIVKEDIIDEQ